LHVCLLFRLAVFILKKIPAALIKSTVGGILHTMPSWCYERAAGLK
jgi:hypothetical protein